jgi:SM-20-related protein
MPSGERESLSSVEPSEPIQFQINQELDRDQLRQKFHQRNRVNIQNFLCLPGVEALYDHLANEIEWSYFLFGDSHLWEVTPESRREYTSEQEDALYDVAYSAVQSGYSFLYETNRLTTREANGATKRVSHSSLMAAFDSFLNSEAFLEFAKQVTGQNDVVRTEANATSFRPGHFLAAHDDSASGTRRLAFVVNLGRSWRPEWGGLLEFISPGGHIEEAFVPYFNSLNLFRVPQAHAVSCVAPFAPTPRFAVSGWLHAR